MDVINAARREKENGTALILWTCRAGERLGEAVAWCAGFGLTFDAVNANLPERLAHFKTESRKVSADEYWDDAAVVMGREAEAPAQEETQEIRERMMLDAVLRDAIKTWGMEAQQRMMIEEMSELTKAVCKLARAKIGAEAELAVESIREEMADVQVYFPPAGIAVWRNGYPRPFQRGPCNFTAHSPAPSFACAASSLRRRRSIFFRSWSTGSPNMTFSWSNMI